MQNQILQLSNAIEKLIAGILPSAFIPPSRIRETISDIDHTLLEMIGKVRILHQEPSYYYAQQIVQIVIPTRIVAVTVKVRTQKIKQKVRMLLVLLTFGR